MREVVRMRRLALIVTVLTAFCGCATTSGSGEQKPEIQVARPEVFLGEEVPVYPGFKLIPEKSFSYESGNLKVGRFVFKGKALVKDIVAYYRDNLPEHGWEPVAITVYGKQASLTYITPEKSLQIHVAKKFSEVYLVIQIGPRGEVPQAGETPPQEGLTTQ